MRALAYLVLATLCFGAGAATAQDGHASAEEFFATLPSPTAIVRGAAFVTPAPDDGVLQARAAAHSGFTAEETARLQAIGAELQNKHGADQAAQMADPLWKEMQALAMAPTMRENSADTDILYQRARAYSEATRNWLKQKSLSTVPAWKGRLVLLLDGPVDDAHPQRILRYSALVDFLADNGYYDLELGRQIWSGGYDVTFCSDETGPEKGFGAVHPVRTIKRPGKAFCQMFLGREGWFIKLNPVRSNDFVVWLPRLSSALLNLPRLDLPGSGIERVVGQVELLRPAADSSGQELPDAYIQGFPSRDPGARQRGAIVYQRASGGTVRLGWDFAPAPKTP